MATGPATFIVLLVVGLMLVAGAILLKPRGRTSRPPAQASKPARPCRECGHTNVAAARYCAHCGADLTPGETQSDESEV